MYCNVNPKTKKEFKELVSKGGVRLVQYGPFDNPAMSGETVIEGPQYPAPHRWYARVKCVDGAVVKVLG